MKKKLIWFSSLVLGLVPFMAFAQPVPAPCTGIGLGTIEGIICKIGDILDIIIPVLVILGVVYFVWGVVMYVISSDEEAKKTGRDRMIYGIIGLVVIVAMWGLVGIVRTTFGLGGGAQSPDIPRVTF